MHLAWLVVNHSGTLASAQLGEDPHPEAGGNLEQNQIGPGLWGEVGEVDSCFETRPRVNCAKVFGLLVIWLGLGGLMGRLGDSRGPGECLVGSVQRVPEPDPLPGISFDTRPDLIQF